MNYSKIGLICLFILAFNYSKAECTTIKDGDWSDPNSWSCGRVPADYDVITIPIGFVINIDKQIKPILE